MSDFNLSGTVALWLVTWQHSVFSLSAYW